MKSDAPITLEELKQLGRRIDTEFVVAEGMDDLYKQLNQNYNHNRWTLLRAPVWCGDKLVAVVIKPRDDSDDEDAEEQDWSYLAKSELGNWAKE